jgi:hypothetical protein
MNNFKCQIEILQNTLTVFLKIMFSNHFKITSLKLLKQTDS